MKNKDFELILKGRLDAIKATLSKKAVEYASTDDRLWNFKRAGRISETNPALALKGIMMKHIVSVFDLIDKYPKQIAHDLINEKICDSINYLILLEAILKEAEFDAK